MPGKPIKVGPFTGGLNNISQFGEADDDEVVELYNLEVANDTSLTSRPPMTLMAGSTLPTDRTLGWEVHGIYRVSESEWYLIASYPNSSANTIYSIRAYANGVIDTLESGTLIRTVGLVNRPTAMVQFKDYLYFLTGADSTVAPYKWRKGDTAVTDVTAMKKGTVLITWKGRLWVTGTKNFTTGDRVYFSDVGASGPTPDVWPATSFFDVAPGEGGFITALIPSYNNLIIFKTDGTWRFSYPSKPENGQIDKINGAVGAANANSVLEYENFIYVYDQGAVYELINSSYTQINRYVKFRTDPYGVDAVAPGVNISIVNRRLVVRYFNALYVFNIETKTWSNWQSYIGTPGKFLQLPVDSESAASSQYVAASMGTLQSVTTNMINDPSALTADVRAARSNAEGGIVDIENGVYTFLTYGTSDAGSVYFNRTGSADEYDIPVSVGQTMELTVEFSEIAATSGMRVDYYTKAGNIITQTFPVLATGMSTFNSVVPAEAILAKVSAYITGPDKTIKFSGVSITRKAVSSPFNLIRIQDEYIVSEIAIEYIDCWVETKTYDYQAAGVTKRMFSWGIDVASTRAIQAEARPVARLIAPTWDQLENYMWDELELGTWDNPLSWMGASRDVVDYSAPSAEIQSNGRFYIKLKKGMRFRQISYFLKLSTLGTKLTGPAKLFSLTTIVLPKQDAVDKVS